jgi:hypothetical protein
MEHLYTRAVVGGGGIGGLAAAGALAPYFREVEIFDRDDLPASAASRAGAPQDRHSHGLLARGLKALGEIYPGFQADLIGAGAVPVRVAQDVRFERPDIGVLPQRDSSNCSGLPSMPCTGNPRWRKIVGAMSAIAVASLRSTPISNPAPLIIRNGACSYPPRPPCCPHPSRSGLPVIGLAAQLRPGMPKSLLSASARMDIAKASPFEPDLAYRGQILRRKHVACPGACRPGDRGSGAPAGGRR